MPKDDNRTPEQREYHENIMRYLETGRGDLSNLPDWIIETRREREEIREEFEDAYKKIKGWSEKEGGEEQAIPSWAIPIPDEGVIDTNWEFRKHITSYSMAVDYIQSIGAGAAYFSIIEIEGEYDVYFSPD